MKQAEGGNASVDRNENEFEKNISREKLLEPIYYVQSLDDPTVLIANDVTIERYKINGEKSVAIIRWYDSNRERTMVASETKQEEGNFSFKRSEDEGGGFYTFVPMKLEIYYEKVKHRLTNGSDFTNDEELIKAFLLEIEDEW